MSFKFIAYADIHYDRLAAQCVTFDDCAEVEQQVHQRVFEGDFDFTVFIGDRFLKRNPEDEIKTKADQVLLSILGKDERRAPHYSLIGNHDWVTNSMRWHTSESLKWLSRFTGKLNIMDEAKTYQTLVRGKRFENVLIHALPAGAKFDFSKYQTDPKQFNLFLFHDMLKGSFMDDSEKMKFDSGIEISEIDRPEFDMVLAGDIHVPQPFPLKNVPKGGYVGAVLQRTRADADKERGWVEVYVEGKPGAWEIHTDFMTTKPLFSCLSFDVGPQTNFDSLAIDENLIVDKRIEVKLTGKKIDVDRVADDPRWKNYVDLLGARKMDIARDYENETKDAVIDLSMSRNISHDLELYLDSGFGSLGNLGKEKMFEVLGEVENG
jgi:hypothetical protein